MMAPSTRSTSANENPAPQMRGNKITDNERSRKTSVIITILNGEKWIDSCFESIRRQIGVQHNRTQVTSCDSTECADGKLFALEICVFEDCSTDRTPELLLLWKEKLEAIGIQMLLIRNESGSSKGVGYGRNKAIASASGSYLCFQDVDDEMLPNRIVKQYSLASENPDAIIGSKFIRVPSNSTCRFSRWANELDPLKLSIQIYTANGPTVIMPTWFCHRDVFERVPGGFCENGQGTPEDLIFFYEHLDRGGRILRIDDCLVKYRYHPEATTFSIGAQTIWCLRMKHIITNVLHKKPWSEGFTIWNAGKQGRKFFRDLPVEEKLKVRAFCDVDMKKVTKFYKFFDEVKRKTTFTLPIIHFTEAKPPLVICMKLDLTNGGFEANLMSLKLTEGKDYVLFT